MALETRELSLKDYSKATLSYSSDYKIYCLKHSTLNPLLPGTSLPPAGRKAGSERADVSKGLLGPEATCDFLLYYFPQEEKT